MLNKVTVSNVYSFGSTVEFSLVAERKTSKHTDHIVEVNRVKTLRGAIVYGPNAAGKSNLLKSVELLINMLGANVCGLASGCQFRLDDKVKAGMSWVLEYSFAGQTFRYSVGTDGRRILSEKLECLSMKGDGLLFDRFAGKAIVFGSLLQGEAWYAQRTCTADSFYLRKLELDAVRELPESTLGKGIIVAALDGLHSIHVVRTHSALNPNWFMHLINTNDYRDFLLNLMKESDVGITDLSWTKVSASRLRMLLPNPAPFGLSAPINIVRHGETFYAIISQKGKVEAYEFRLVHGKVPLRANEESDGTIRLLHQSAFLYSLKQEESTWFVDEIDCHLHPFLARFILSKVLALQGSRSQLIVTAHDTNLMTQKLWRTDEVWFVQKRMDGTSDLYSLYQFTPRADKNLSDGYLKGIYGALPCIGGEMIHA